MATNPPPFHVDDQTDEDFFDKLVDDDDDVAFKPSGEVSDSFGGVESDLDEAKAFANLSLGEESVSNLIEGAEGVSNLIEGGEDASNLIDGGEHVRNLNEGGEDVNVEDVGTLEKKSNSSSGSVIEHEGNLGSVFGNSPGGGVKEVQWDAFGADSDNNNNGFDFFNELGDNTAEKKEDIFIGSGNDAINNSFNENGFIEGAEVAGVEQSVVGEGTQNLEYWENQYPGWKFDANTGQWYQIDMYNTLANDTLGNDTYADTGVSDGNSQVSYLQQSSQPLIGAVADCGTIESVSHLNHSIHANVANVANVANESVSNWTDVSSVGSENVSNFDQFSSVNNGYPEHMIFDPQYPGWYYDSIAQEWRTLDSYTSSVQVQDQTHRNVYGSNVSSSHENVQSNFGNFSQVDSYKPQGTNVQNQDFGSFNSNYNNQQGYNTWQPEKTVQTGPAWDSIGNQRSNSFSTFSTDLSTTNHVNQHNSFDARETVPYYQDASQGQNDFRTNGSQGFVPTMNYNQQVNQPFMPHNQQTSVSNDYYTNQNSFNSLSPQFQNTHQLSPQFQNTHPFSQASNTGRSSAGRPAHALVTFGFGGKLIVMKDDSSFGASSYGTQGSLGGTISVLNLMEVVMEKSDPPSMGMGGSDYFTSLCKRSFPGPLVGGNVGSLNKWIDEKIASLDTSNGNYRTDEVLKLVFSLLKIACQNYGKLRSPFGTEAAVRENDAPESAVARLFASVKGISAELNNYNSLAHCLQSLPSEEQMRVNAAEVQRLLVCGKKKEALEFATDGQLWGPALVLAAQLGDQYYCETVKQMALRQLVAGSPLRTLCLLIAGQPADVFSPDSSSSNAPGSANMFQQPTQLQHGINCMLDHWEENLAVIAANRTKDDELVLVHLGDSLWKNRSDIIAAHICYLVADANFEPYSDIARLCLIGADHWKLPRTYASPDAIQRTEIYEYSKLLGNSQFILPSFQPYKLIYALMLAEVGKVTEAIKYCQAVSKSLKTGRTPEVDTLRQLVSSLEERLKTHQQGGFSSNLAPAKIVRKVLNLFDNTASRVIGGLPPPIPSPSQSKPQFNEQYHQTGSSISTSQSTMAMSSLIPSASTETINDGSRMSFHNRSASEPDIGRTPRQGDSSKENAHGKASGASRFGRFGFGSQLLQKTVGLVMKPRQDKQAKLGDSNKFYYDENLKRWVEEGAEPAAEEVAPPPPPTTAAFQNGISDYNSKNALRSEGSRNGSPEYRSPNSLDHSPGIPPLPTASNQFSARGRMGVRSRYVDTFNKGGNSVNSFQSPAVPSIKPVTGANPKFFVPSPVSAADHSHEATNYISQEPTQVGEMSSTPSPSMGMQRYPSNTSISEMSSIPPGNGSFATPPPSVTMQRYPSLDNITRREGTVNGSGLISSSSRRTASWSGSLNDASTPPNRTGVKPLGEVLGMPPSLFMPNDPSPLSRNNGSFDEVEL